MKFDAGLVGPVFRDSLDQIGAAPKFFVPIYGAATLAGVGFDLCNALDPRLLVIWYVAFWLVMVCLQSWVTRNILARAGIALRSPRDWRIAALFGIGLYTGLGILCGLLLFVLPGLFLMGRWFVAVPALFGEDVSGSEAMNVSWQSSERYWLSGALLGTIALAWKMVPLIFFADAASPDGAASALGRSVLINAVSQAGWLFGVVAAARLHLFIGNRRVSAQEIFG
ncbi:MAG: hypothetical protein WA940_15775 [Sphingopyxis sp.]